jgi:hypothetical protein
LSEGVEATLVALPELCRLVRIRPRGYSKNSVSITFSPSVTCSREETTLQARGTDGAKYTGSSAGASVMQFPSQEVGHQCDHTTMMGMNVFKILHRASLVSREHKMPLLPKFTRLGSERNFYLSI